MLDFSHQTIKGYQLRERLGAGGFGAVYKAYQTVVERDVAIKIILPGLANQPDFIRRFETEAQVIARLEHPCIVPLYDYWRDPDGAYLVMRWLRGGSLADLLTRGALDVETISRLLDQIGAALALAHRNNIIHRDIKPGNILLDEDSNAYLADFGIAKDLQQAGSGTQVDAIIGSLDYISPEQARSETVTPRTDIYSLGVVLYEMLTGEHPFSNMTSIERLYKHINDPLPDLTTLDDAIREEVNGVVQKATAKNPLLRYETVSEFAAAFKEAAGLNRVATSNTLVALLTQREQEVLNLLVAGLSNKDIAQKLVVTVATVKWYINELFRKLRVRSRVQAIVRARELNLMVPAGASDGTTAPSRALDNLPEPENPYKGLRAFQAADERDFFGREELVQKLLKRLTPAPTLTKTDDEARFLAVVGPSGSGKSSVVRAGLLPALLRGGIPGSERWFVVELVPGARPYDELEIALLKIAPGHLQLSDQLRRDEHGLLRAAQLLLPNDQSELVIVIDQFEEVFTLVEDETVRANFLKLLLATVTAKRSRVRIVVTLRADFYDRPLNYPEFGELLRQHMETILPLSAKGIERAIVEPAKRAGITFEDGLVATMVADVNYQAGALPLLQYALTELFERRQGRVLTQEAYHAIGGAVGALAKRAEALYQELSAAAQAVTRQMFLRLVTLGEGAEDTRRRTARAELAALHPDPEVLDEVIDTYTEYRLLALDNDPASRTPTVEVAHEALLREWERLRAWLNESRHDIRLQRGLANNAEEWELSKRDESYLLVGARLTLFEGWQSTTLNLTPPETAYLTASLARRDRDTHAETARQAREKALENRSQTFLRGLVGVFAVATVIALSLMTIAFRESERANNAVVAEQDALAISEANLQEVRELALVNGAQAAFANDDLDTARALSVVANELNPSPLSQLNLAQVAYAPGTTRVYSDVRYNQEFATAALSPDEHYLITSNPFDVLPVVWDLVSGEVVRVFPAVHQKPIYSMAFRPTNEDENWQLVTGSGDNTLILWDFETLQPIRTFSAHTDEIWMVRFSADGQHLLSASADGTLILWEVNSGNILQTFIGHSGVVASGEFSPDGRTILSGGMDKKVILWEVASGNILDQFEVGILPTGGVVFSPDASQFLAASTPDFSMSLWDIKTKREIQRYRRSGPIGYPHFSQDGQTIFAAEGDFICYPSVKLPGGRASAKINTAGGDRPPHE